VAQSPPPEREADHLPNAGAAGFLRYSHGRCTLMQGPSSPPLPLSRTTDRVVGDACPEFRNVNAAHAAVVRILNDLLAWAG
jgi:hypothetical protein